MPDILIRDVPEEVLAAIDAEAKQLGLSRNEYLRRYLAAKAEVTSPRPKVTVADLQRLAILTADLDDPDVMAEAWR